jgi:hypothetical protein
MGQGPQGTQISTILVDESFANEDDHFVELVRMVASPQYLAGLADRWKRDPRPWAREQIFNYLALALDRPGHHPVVKRLFKHAESSGDHELMATFIVAFDRLVRRQRRMRYRWNFQTRQSWQEEVLYSPRNQIAPAKDQKRFNPMTGKTETVRVAAVPKNGRLFSYPTRRYLSRRACRYFRRLGFQRPAEYTKTVAKALGLYQDDDVAKGENILDNWSLVSIAFRRSPALTFLRRRVEVADGHSLGELSAAPKFERLWKQPEAAAVLLGLLTKADSRLVRVWTIQLLNRHHAQMLRAISADQLLAILDHDDDEVQQFGANLIQTLDSLDTWPIATWLRLLETRSVTALAVICQAMSERVRPERLDLAQCVALACARTTPVARLGLAWLKNRKISSEQDRQALARLAEAKCEAEGAEIAAFGLSILGTPEAYRADTVVKFFDSLNAEVRRGAWNWLTPQSPGYNDPELWGRLLETPYDDVRIQLIGQLSHRVRSGSSLTNRQDFTGIWTAVLLGVHRGGRAKLQALRQVSAAMAEHPEQAEQLIPVLAIAIRSVRPPEVRAGLSAILSAVSAKPELEQALTQRIPELRLPPIGGAL